MEKRDISNYLADYAPFGNGWGGTSWFDQYRNARRQQGALRNLYDTVADEGVSAEDYDYFNSGLKSVKGQAALGATIAGLQGAAQLAGGAISAAQLRDTSSIEGEIADLSRAGNYNYNNFEQLSNDYAQTDFNPSFTYQDIRGMTTGQQVGNVATSALSGAATGFQIGGPWGALVGGVAGLGAGLGGVLTGNARARAKQNALEMDAMIAQDAAQENFQAAHERIREAQNRRGAVNMVANGGKIERKQLTMKEFADRVLTKKGAPAQKIIRTKGEGGTIIRIKVK